MSDACCQLHAHSAMSFKDGLSPENELVKYAAELGQPGIGLTNHGNLFGAPALFQACKEFDIRGVIGMEVYESVSKKIDPEVERERFRQKYDKDVPRYHHLTLWAQTLEGWENLCALHTLSYTEAYKPKNQPLIDQASLERHSAGLILGTGCPQSRINWTLANHGYDAALEEMRWYIEVFEEQAYVEVMAVLPEQLAALRDQRKLAKFFGRPTLGVNDVHYKRRKDGVEHGAHHTLVQARKFKSAATTAEGSSDKSDDSYGSYYGSDGFFMKTREEMLQSGLMAPEVDETIALLDRIEFDFLAMNAPAKPKAFVPELGENHEFDLYVTLNGG